MRETLVQWLGQRWNGGTCVSHDALLARLAQADREYAELRTQVEEAREAHGEACADRDKLRDERERLLRLLANAEEKLAATAADKETLRKEHYALAARCDQRQEYIDQLTADKEALRQERKELRTQVEEARENHGAACKERDEALAELDGVRKERDQLRESLAWANDQRANLRGAYDRSLKQCAALNDALESERRAKRDQKQNTVPSRPAPTQLEIATRVAGGMTCEVHWDDDLVLGQCADAAWRLAGELLAKAGTNAGGEGREV